MSLAENSNQLFLPGGATNSQNSPYISVWPLHYKLQVDNHGITNILIAYINIDLAHHEIFLANVGKGGIIKPTHEGSLCNDHGTMYPRQHGVGKLQNFMRKDQKCDIYLYPIFNPSIYFFLTMSSAYMSDASILVHFRLDWIMEANQSDHGPYCLQQRLP